MNVRDEPWPPQNLSEWAVKSPREMTAEDLGIVRPFTRWSNFAFAQRQIMRAHEMVEVPYAFWLGAGT